MKLEREKFENALKDVNKSHTIWRCRTEESDYDHADMEKYSTSWLESVWDEYYILDDRVEEIIYAYSISTALDGV